MLMQTNDRVKSLPETDKADPKTKNSSLRYPPFVRDTANPQIHDTGRDLQYMRIAFITHWQLPS